jgi:xanthine dehydrogenase YagT iron-sulfur-binding subunit
MPPESSAIPVTLRLNGAERTLTVDPATTLLDALRERAGLTGTKKSCDRGQCGACTVLVDGRRVLACLTLAAMHAGQSVTTIEGLAEGGALHPLQRAFVEHDALQCGYCTSGQILSGIGAIAEGRTADDAAIREAMSGNLCRCGAYPNIVAAIRAVTEASR